MRTTPPNRRAIAPQAESRTLLDVEHIEHVGENSRGGDPAERGGRVPVSIGIHARQEMGRRVK